MRVALAGLMGLARRESIRLSDVAAGAASSAAARMP